MGLKSFIKNKKILCIVISVLFYLFILWKVPECYIYSYFKLNSVKEQLDSIKELRNVGLSIGGGLLAFIGIYLTWRRTKALDKQNETSESNLKALIEKNRQDDEKDRKNFILQQYSKASELLAKDDNIISRLSGITLFEKIMNEYEEYHWAIVELLSTYFREKRSIKENNHLTLSSNFMPEDCIAILKVLEKRNKKFELVDGENVEQLIIQFNKSIELENVKYTKILKRAKKIDLSNSFIQGYTFDDPLYFGFDFENSVFSDCVFKNTNFSFCKFNECILYGNCNFKGTRFIESHLDGATFNEIKLFSHCSFATSYIVNVKFINCELSNCDFGTASDSCSFYGSTLDTCKFDDAHLSTGEIFNDIKSMLNCTFDELLQKKLNQNGINVLQPYI